MVFRTEERGDPGQELAALAGIEVADRAAEEGEETGAAVALDALEVGLEVADEAAHVEARVLVDEQTGGLVGDLLGDVDRHVGLAGTRPRASR